MRRAVLLQTEATPRKLGILRDFAEKAVKCSNWMLSNRLPGESATSLQSRTLQEAKSRYSFNVQVVCALARSLAKTKGKRVDGVTVKFNVPRNCKTFKTEEFDFVELGLYPGKRVAIPIRKNRNWDRFRQCLCRFREGESPQASAMGSLRQSAAPPHVPIGGYHPDALKRGAD
jgi:hypothetical protein